MKQISIHSHIRKVVHMSCIFAETIVLDMYIHVFWHFLGTVSFVVYNYCGYQVKHTHLYCVLSCFMCFSSLLFYCVRSCLY